MVAERRNNVMNLSKDLDTRFKNFLETKKHYFNVLNARFLSLDPKALLKRGYIMATDERGKVVISVKKLKKGVGLRLGFADGHAEVIVNEVKKNKE